MRSLMPRSRADIFVFFAHSNHMALPPTAAHSNTLRSLRRTTISEVNTSIPPSRNLIVGLSGPMDIIASLPSTARLSGVLRMRIVEDRVPRMLDGSSRSDSDRVNAGA